MKVYAQDGTFKRYAFCRSDFKAEEKLENGIVRKQLNFRYPLQDGRIYCEDLIEYGGERYRVKEAPIKAGKGAVTALQDTYALSGNPIREWEAAEKNVLQCVTAVLQGTGWACKNVSAGTDDVRSVSEKNTDSMKAIEKIAEIFWVEIAFSTKGRTVYLYDRVGSRDRPARFLKGFNLKSLEVKTDSHDFYTRIYPIGKDGLTIGSVNGGVDYLENTQYSGTIRTAVWEDGNYTDAGELKKACEKKLAEVSAPKTVYTAQILDVANIYDGYEDFAFGIGDDADISDPDIEVSTRERIVSIVRHPDNPEKNTVELANRTTSFSDMQKKVLAAMEVVGKVTDGNKIIINPITDAEIDSICI